MYDTGKQIARLRKEKGLSQVALGKVAGTTGKYISDLEHGKPAGIHVLARIAAVLDVPLEKLYVKPR